MPIDLESLQADPDFLYKFPDAIERQKVLERLRAEQARAATPPQSPQSAPQATPAPGSVNLDTLKTDPEFQALSAQEQAQLMQRVQAQSPAGMGGVLPVPPADQPLEEGFTKPSTMIPLLTGFGIPGRVAMAPALRGANQLVEASGFPAVAGKIVRPVIEGLSQTLGYGTGRVLETGQLPSPGELATEFAVTAGTGRILEDIGAIGADFLRRSKGGQAIINADKFTQEAHAKWQADTQAAEDAARSQQKELYDTAVIKARASQRDYEMARRQRQQTIETNQADYEAALRAQQADDLAREQARTQKMTQRQEEYTGAIQSQEAALSQARAVPGTYAPATPSWVLYEKYGDAAKDTVVDLAPAKSAMAELRVQRGTLPDGTLRPFPTAVEKIAGNLEKAAGSVNFQTIREELRTLGPLTRSSDGNIRGPAKQLFGIYADVLDAAPGANDLLKQANANFRREMAIKDMDDWLKPGHGIVARDRFNREKIDVAKLFTKLDTTMNEDALFRGSFRPDELQAIRADFGTLAGTPTMPRQAPRELAPVRPGTPPVLKREPAPVALPADVHVPQVPLPAEEGATGVWPTLARTPAPASTTTYEALGPKPAGASAGLGYLAQLMGIPPAVVSVVKSVIPGTAQARWLFAHSMLDARSRRMMQAAINGEGILNPQFYSVMLASLSPAERKAFERETGGAATSGHASQRAPGGAARQTD